MSIKSFQDFHMLNEGKKLKDWQYTGTVSVGSNNAIYYQYPNNVKYYVSVTPEEFEDYLEGGSLRKKLEKQWADSGKAMTSEEFEAKYMPKGPQGLGKYLSQGGRMWDHVESSEDDMYVEAARSWELMETSHIKHEVRKIMKLAKNRPAPFSVVAIKDGKVVAQDIDIKIWQSILAHYREMAKAHPDAKIHVEDSEGQSVMESVNEAKSPSIVVTINKSNRYYNDGPRDLSGWYAKELSEYLFGSKYNLQVTDLGKDQFTLEFTGKGLSNIDSKVDDYVNRLNNAWKGEGLKISLDESVNEGSGTIAKGAYSFAEYFGIPVSRLKGFKFDGTDDVEELHKVLGRASSNIKGTENIYKVSITESVDRSNFNQLAYLSSVEYQKVKKLKNFNAADWKWDSKKDLYKNVRIEESVNEAGGTIAKGAYSFADYFGIPVSRLKGFKFDGTDDVEELHKVLGRASSNIKGTETIYKASITESADMLPSFEVIAGLATVLGALDLAQAVKGGDSIIVDVTKALKAELGDKLEAAGAEARRVVSKFKNDPKVKEIIMDAEEEISESIKESKKSTATKISLFEEYFNEAKSDVTPGSRVEVTGKSIGNMGKTLQGEVTRKNSNGTYEVSIDNGDMADYKADELKLIESYVGPESVTYKKQILIDDLTTLELDKDLSRKYNRGLIDIPGTEIYDPEYWAHKPFMTLLKEVNKDKDSQFEFKKNYRGIYQVYIKGEFEVTLETNRRVKLTPFKGIQISITIPEFWLKYGEVKMHNDPAN